MVETEGLGEKGLEYEILGPEGPHQSICGGKSECVPGPAERFSATLEPICVKLKPEELESTSPGTTGYEDKESLKEQKETVDGLPKDLEGEKIGVV